MIVCPRCSKENQDHYKFCLGCGAELPRDAAQPKSFTAPTPPAGVPTGGAPGGGFGAPAPAPSAGFGAPAPAPSPGFGAPAPAPSAGFGSPAPSPSPGPGFAPSASPMPAPSAPAPAPSAPAPAPAAAAPSGNVACPQCGNSVPPNFKFCGSCGYDMTKVAAAAPAAAPAPAPAAPATGGAGSLVLIRPDGSEGESFPLSATTTVGRESGGAFASDSYLSPRHAEIVVSSGKATLRDLDSLNGIYVRIARDTPTELVDGAIFRIGQEILMFQRLSDARAHADGTEAMGGPDQGAVGRIRLIIGRESFGGSYIVPATGMHLGRERGDVIFPEDGYVSGLHCRIHEENGRIWLTDVGSSNGTFVRVAGSQEVPAGSLLLMGQQLFRLEC